MNKTTVYCVASALAVSMVSSPVLNVMAKTKNETTPIVQEQTPIQIQNAEEFISKYLYVEVNQNDKTNELNQDEDSIQVLITAATKENYEKLLEGNEVFKTLSLELQNEIKKDYQTEYDKIVKIQEEKNKDLDAYTVLMKQAMDVEKEVQEENKKQNTASNIETNENTDSKTTEKEDSKDSASKEKEDLKNANQQENTVIKKSEGEIDSGFSQPVQEDSSKNESEVATQSSEKSTILKTESSGESSTQSATEAKVSAQSENQSALQVSLPQVESKIQQSNTAGNQLNDSLMNEASVSTSNTQENQIVSKQVSSMSSAAQNFIKTYLTSASGNLFASANNLNYQKIISAMPSWMKLSTTDRNAVNDELVSKVGKKYQKLLQEAQQLSITSGKYVPVNTATNTNTTFYAWLCAASIGMLTFVLKRLRKQD